MEARSIRRLLMLTLLTTLVLSPTAFAASSEGAAGSLASTVDQTVGAVSDVTGQVTTTVETALPPAQPVTSTAQHVTTDLTQQATTAVEKVTPVAGRVPPVVEEAAASVDDAASGVAHESRAAKPPSASPATPPGPVHSPDRERTSVRDSAVPVRTDTAPRHPAEGRQAERSGSEKDGRELLATARPPDAPSASPAARTYPDDGVLDAEPSARGHDVPAMAVGSASAASGGAAVAGLALLAVAFCLTEPRLLRSLLAVPANMRPVLFVSALERPG